MSNRLGRSALLLLPIYFSGLASGLAQEPGYRPGRNMVRTKAISLEELADEAKTIFLGEVTQVKIQPMNLGGKSPRKIRVVTFKVLESSKGDLKKDQTVTYPLSPLVDASIDVGDKLLWYLPEKSSLGLFAPVGLHSGFFRVLPRDQLEPTAKKAGGKPELRLAVNLKGNEGLFPKELAGITPGEVKVASEMTSGGVASRELLQSYADKAGEAQPLPLELLIAATNKRVKPQLTTSDRFETPGDPGFEPRRPGPPILRRSTRTSSRKEG